MATYREAVYMVLDLIKLNSDDAYYTEDHIIYLLDKYRAYVLKSKFDKDPSGEISDSNYQVITLPLQGYVGGDTERVTTVDCPEFAGIGRVRMFWSNEFSDELTYVEPERYRYAGINKYMTTCINYATHSYDDKLHLKGPRVLASSVTKVVVRAIFESPSEAIKAANANNPNLWDILDASFPLEENLMPLVIDYVVKELNVAAYNPEDKQNNADDNLAGLTVRGVNYRAPKTNKFKEE